MSYLAMLQADAVRAESLQAVANANRYQQQADEARAAHDYAWAERMQWLADSQRRIAALRAERAPTELRRAA